MIPEPEDGKLAIWFQAGMPWVFMIRIDAYEDDEALGEHWFVAEQYFTDSDSSIHGYTWPELLEKFSHLDGPWFVYDFYRNPGARNG